MGRQIREEVSITVPMGIKVLVSNRKAFHEYTVSNQIEAGIVLTGTEVKSLRLGKGNLSDGWVNFQNGEAILMDVHISPYSHGNIMNHPEKRPRKLLMHRRELVKLESQVAEKGFAIIPLKMYFKGRCIKVELGLGKGKKHYDKRESEKTKHANRDMARALKNG